MPLGDEFAFLNANTYYKSTFHSLPQQITRVPAHVGNRRDELLAVKHGKLSREKGDE